jgi:hypothetical protein
VFTVDGDRVLDARGVVLARVVPAGLVASDAGPRVTMDPDGRWVIDGLGAAVLGPDGALLDDHGRTLTLEPDGMVRLRTIRGRTSVAPVRVEGLTPARRRVALGVVLLALREERQAQAPEGVDAGQGAPADASPDAQRPGR